MHILHIFIASLTDMCTFKAMKKANEGDSLRYILISIIHMYIAVYGCVISTFVHKNSKC